MTRIVLVEAPILWTVDKDVVAMVGAADEVVEGTVVIRPTLVAIVEVEDTVDATTTVDTGVVAVVVGDGALELVTTGANGVVLAAGVGDTARDTLVGLDDKATAKVHAPDIDVEELSVPAWLDDDVCPTTA